MRLPFELLSLTQKPFANFLRNGSLQIAGDKDREAFRNLMRQVPLVRFTAWEIHGFSVGQPFQAAPIANGRSFENEGLLAVRVRLESLTYCRSTSPTSMYCPPPVCLQCTASVFLPGFNNLRAASSTGTSTYCVV